MFVIRDKEQPQETSSLRLIFQLTFKDRGDVNNRRQMSGENSPQLSTSKTFVFVCVFNLFFFTSSHWSVPEKTANIHNIFFIGLKSFFFFRNTLSC